ncbi:hypothetical protein ACLOJK_014542 [Asimina triloba]
MRVTHPDPAIHAQISPNQLQIHGSELHFHVCRWYPWPFQNPIRKSAPTLSISKYRAAPSSTIQMECTPHQRLDPKPSKSAIQAASHQRNPSRPNSHQPWAMAASSDRHQRSEPLDHE